MKRILGYVYRLFFKKKANKEIAPDIFSDLKTLCNGRAVVVFDIGAHHGDYAKRITNAVTLDYCYCFEPFKTSYEVLKSQLTENKFRKFQIALSDFEGYSDFYANQFDQTNSLLPAVKTNSSIDTLIANQAIVKVKVDTLDNFCDKNEISRIDILKIDTQGNTYGVLNGAKYLLENGLIGIIQCEVEFIEIYKDEQLFHKIAIFLEEYGYELYSLYNLHFDINNRLSWADAIFIKNDKTGNP